MGLLPCILVPLVRSVPGGTIEGILGASMGSIPIVRPSTVTIWVPQGPGCTSNVEVWGDYQWLPKQP